MLAHENAANGIQMKKSLSCSFALFLFFSFAFSIFQWNAFQKRTRAYFQFAARKLIRALCGIFGVHTRLHIHFTALRFHLPPQQMLPLNA